MVSPWSVVTTQWWCAFWFLLNLGLPCYVSLNGRFRLNLKPSFLPNLCCCNRNSLASVMTQFTWPEVLLAESWCSRPFLCCVLPLWICLLYGRVWVGQVLFFSSLCNDLSVQHIHCNMHMFCCRSHLLVVLVHVNPFRLRCVWSLCWIELEVCQSNLRLCDAHMGLS